MNADFQRIVNAGRHSIAFYLDEVAEKLEDHMDKLSKVRLPAEGDEEKLASLRRITDQILELIKSQEWLQKQEDIALVGDTIQDLLTNIHKLTPSELYDIEATLDKYVHLSW